MPIEPGKRYGILMKTKPRTVSLTVPFFLLYVAESYTHVHQIEWSPLRKTVEIVSWINIALMALGVLVLLKAWFSLHKIKGPIRIVPVTTTPMRLITILCAAALWRAEIEPQSGIFIALVIMSGVISFLVKRHSEA